MTTFVKDIQNGLNSILNWLLLSSKNPTQASMTFKGVIIGSVIPMLSSLSVTMGWQGGTLLIQQVGNDAVLVVQAVFAAIAAWMVLIGGLRKIYLSLSGKNAVVTPQVTTSAPTIAASDVSVQTTAPTTVDQTVSQG